MANQTYPGASEFWFDSLGSDVRPTESESDGFSTGTPQDQEALAHLREVLTRKHGREVGIAAVRPSLPPQRANALRLQRFVANTFGRRIVWFRCDDTLALDGVTLGGSNDRIFIRAGCNLPVERIAGHELIHSLRRSAPEVYEDIAAAVDQMTHRRSEYGERIRATYKAEGLSIPDQDAINEEFVADVVGAFWVEPGFMREIAARMEPGRFKRFANYCLAWLDRMQARIKGQGRGVLLRRFGRDISSLRKAVLEGMEQFARRRAVTYEATDHEDIRRIVNTHAGSHQEGHGDARQALVLPDGHVEPFLTIAGGRERAKAQLIKALERREMNRPIDPAVAGVLSATHVGDLVFDSLCADDLKDDGDLVTAAIQRLQEKAATEPQRLLEQPGVDLRRRGEIELAYHEAVQALEVLQRHGLRLAANQSNTATRTLAADALADARPPANQARATPCTANDIENTLHRALAAVREHIPVRVTDVSPAVYFGAKRGDGVEGAFLGNEIVLFAGSIVDTERALKVLRHEAVGHFSMEQMLGADFPELLREVKYLSVSDSRAMAIGQQVLERYPGIEAGSDTFAREFIAQIAEDNTPIPIRTRLLGRMKGFLRRMGLTHGPLSLAELSVLLSDAGRWLLDGSRAFRIRPTPATFSKSTSVFYSQMAQVLADKLPGKGEPAQMAAAILAFARKGHIKQEEVEETGILDWIGSQEQKLTKAEVLNAAATLGVRLGEVVKSNPADIEVLEGSEQELPLDPEWLDREVSSRLADVVMDIATAQGVAPESVSEVEARAEARRQVEIETQGSRDTRCRFQCHAGAVTIDYILERKEGWGCQLTRGVYSPNDGSPAYEPAVIATYATINNHQVQELIRQDAVNILGGGSEKKGSSNKVQWARFVPEPKGTDYRELLITLSNGPGFNSSHWSEEDILAHLRFDTRYDMSGRKTLMVIEIQSDWHQAGRSNGYFPSAPEYMEVSKDFDMLQNEVAETRQYLLNHIKGSTALNADEKALAMYDVHMEKPEVRPTPTDPELEEGMVHYQRLLSDHRKADHFMQSLSTLVPGAPFKKTWPLLAMKRVMRLACEEGFTRVAWISGKDSANATGGNSSWFYDRNLPNIVGRYIKKWGSKIDQPEVPGLTGVHGFDITEDMRAALLAGQPMFSRAPAPGQVGYDNRPSSEPGSAPVMG